MTVWQVAVGGNLLIGVAYGAIAYLVLRGLGRTGQLRANRLGLATGLIFLICGIHHGWHAVQLLLPTLGVADAGSLALREAWPWESAVLDVLSGAVAIFYLSLRGQYAGLLAGAGMYEDLRARERQALEINDNIVQGLARVKWALEAHRHEEAQAAADATLAEAQRMVTDLLMAGTPDGALQAGRLRREASLGSSARPAAPAAD